MGAARGRQDASVEGRLRREPSRFEFVAAVRALTALYHERALRDPRWRREPVGGDDTRRTEVVRFRSAPSLSFPPGEIAAFMQPRPEGIEHESELPPPEMVISFLGLIGPVGALPSHYTSDVISRLRARDPAMRDFLDLFQHRTASLFYRASTKYRLVHDFEEKARERDERRARDGRDRAEERLDLVTACLYALVGLGTDRLRGRSRVPDEVFLYYGGAFARAHAPAVTLARIITEYFGVPAAICQLEGEWLHLGGDGRTLLPSAAEPRGRHNRLGQDAVLGQQVWVVRGNFRIRLGPMDYAAYVTFLPDGGALGALVDLVRTYVGPDLAFDIVPVLRADAVPECALDSFASQPLQLGANVWLRSAPCEQDFDGCVVAAGAAPDGSDAIAL